MRKRSQTTARRLAAGIASAALALALSACGASHEVGATASALLTQNGMTANGMTANGMVANGMTANGMTANGLMAYGLTPDALATGDFTAWWIQDPALADMVMKYLTKCAMNVGDTLSYDDGMTVYTWYGNLGLAPTWASGQPMPPAEQQLMTACLAAHSNRFGLHIQLSVRGLLEDGTPVRLDDGEVDLFPKPEGCFFGNVFDGSGGFAGGFLSAWTADETNPRGCAVEGGLPGDCPPIQNVGTCDDFCTPIAGTTPTVYGDCAVNGVHYLPLTTYLQTSDVYVCGDGVCQFTESPFDPATGLGCASDCGTL